MIRILKIIFRFPFGIMAAIFILPMWLIFTSEFEYDFWDDWFDFMIGN